MPGLNRREFLQRSAWLGSALAAPALLSSCSSSNPEPSGRSQGSGDRPVKGQASVLVGFGTGNDPSQIPAQEELAAAFGREHPGASVSFNRVPDSSTAAQKFTMQLAADDAPNVVLPIGIFGVSRFLDRKVWLDLGTYLSESGVSLDDFQQPAARAARAEAYYGSGSDNVVGVPAGMFTHAVGYNKDLFAKAGIEEPPHEWDTGDWTYDKLVEVAIALTRDGRDRTPDMPDFDAGDIRQFGLGHWDTQIMTLGYGGRAYDPESRKVGYATPEWIAGTQAGVDLSRKHRVLATDELAAQLAAGASDPQQGAWQAGKIAMVDLCVCELASYGKGNAFAWDVAAWPSGPERTVATLDLDVGTIPTASRNYDLGWAVLRDFLTVPQNARALATKGYGAIPALTSESGAFLQSVGGDFPGIDLQVFLDAIPFSTPEAEQWLPSFIEITDLRTLQPLYDGEVSAAEILPKYASDAQRLVDTWFENNRLPSN